jgi:hypothetical protein
LGTRQKTTFGQLAGLARQMAGLGNWRTPFIPDFSSLSVDTHEICTRPPVCKLKFGRRFAHGRTSTERPSRTRRRRFTKRASGNSHSWDPERVRAVAPDFHVATESAQEMSPLSQKMLIYIYFFTRWPRYF